MAVIKVHHLTGHDRVTDQADFHQSAGATASIGWNSARAVIRPDGNLMDSASRKTGCCLGPQASAPGTAGHPEFGGRLPGVRTL